MKNFCSKNKVLIAVGCVLTVILIGFCIFTFTKKNTTQVNPDVKLSDYKSIDLSNVTEDENVQDVILLELLEHSEVPAPNEEDIQEYIKALDSFYTAYAEEVGVDKETFIKEYVGVEDFDSIARESAIQYLNSKAILEEIANREKIELTDEDYDKYLESLLPGTVFDNVDDYKAQIELYGETEDMKEAAYFDKVLNHLEEINTK